MQAGFLGEGRSSRVRRGMWRAARSEPTAGSGSAARHSAPPRCRACRWHAGSRAYRSTAAQAARMLPAVFKRAMLALLERVAADPLLQWRWPPLRQGIGRRWSLKVSERFSAHWHWLPMAHFEAAAGQPWQQGFIRADEVPPAHHCDREHGSEARIRAHGRFDRDLPAATAGPPPAMTAPGPFASQKGEVDHSDIGIPLQMQF